MPSYWYWKSHYGDKTVLQPPYLHNEISYTSKTTFILRHNHYIETQLVVLLVAVLALWTKQIIKTKQGFKEFASHLIKELSVEHLLFILEYIRLKELMYKYSIINLNEYIQKFHKDQNKFDY